MFLVIFAVLVVPVCYFSLHIVLAKSLIYGLEDGFLFPVTIFNEVVISGNEVDEMFITGLAFTCIIPVLCGISTLLLGAFLLFSTDLIGGNSNQH